MTKVLKTPAKINRNPPLKISEGFDRDSGFIFSDDIQDHIKGKSAKRKEYHKEYRRKK
jgi:hypothetical protein